MGLESVSDFLGIFRLIKLFFCKTNSQSGDRVLRRFSQIAHHDTGVNTAA